jgi:hypothetical protein
MDDHAGNDGSITRRNVLTASAALIAGGTIGSGVTALAAEPTPPADAPPLPWK